MRGTILGYDPLTAEGVISGDDGQRATFKGTEWKSPAEQLRVGASVDYELNDGVASSVYFIPYETSSTDFGHVGAKSNVSAGLLALFLGGLGIHKFYMGYNTEGLILLGATCISWLFSLAGIGLIGLFAIAVLVLVEAVIYLTMGQEKFTEVYIEGKKSWL